MLIRQRATSARKATGSVPEPKILACERHDQLNNITKFVPINQIWLYIDKLVSQIRARYAVVCPAFMYHRSTVLASPGGLRAEGVQCFASS